MSTAAESSTTDTTNHSSETEESLRTTYAGAKRRIAVLEQQLQTLQEAGTKRKSDVVSTVTQGRVICRLVSMFQSLDELVEENDRRRAIELDEAEDEDEPQNIDHTLDQCRTFRGYNLLVRHVPGIDAKLVDLDLSPLGIFFRELHKGAGGARGDDAANLKPVIVSWIMALFGNPLPPLSPNIKSNRGFEHDVTGHLLCPIDYDWTDERIRQNIRDGHPDFLVTADSWPAFLYPRMKADNDDMEHGLFQSAVLVKAFKFIFTSPTSAQDISCENDLENQAPQPLKRARNNKAPTRGNVASLLGMRSVTARSIAYVAVQLRFSLSNAAAWNENDGCFSYPVFYNNVVDFFEVTPGPQALAHVQGLLSWWTRKVFGDHRMPMSALSRPGSSVSKLASQRAARELNAR